MLISEPTEAAYSSAKAMLKHVISSRRIKTPQLKLRPCVFQVLLLPYGVDADEQLRSDGALFFYAGSGGRSPGEESHSLT